MAHKLNSNTITNDGYSPSKEQHRRVQADDTKRTGIEYNPYAERESTLSFSALFAFLKTLLRPHKKIKLFLVVIGGLFLLLSLLMVFKADGIASFFMSKPPSPTNKTHLSITQTPLNNSKAIDTTAIKADKAETKASAEPKQDTPAPPQNEEMIAKPNDTQSTVPTLAFASQALSHTQQALARLNASILAHYSDYLRLSQQINLLRQTYTELFEAVNSGAAPNQFIYQSFVKQLKHIADTCQHLHEKKPIHLQQQAQTLAQLKQALLDYQDNSEQLNDLDPNIQLSNQPDNGQLQQILATNIAEQIQILGEFGTLAQQLRRSLQHYVEQEKVLLDFLGDYHTVLHLSTDTLSIQYKASVINRSTDTVYQLYQQLENIAKQQQQIHQQHQHLQQSYIAQYD